MTLIERIKHIANSIADVFAKVPSDIKKYAKEAHKITVAIKEGLNGDITDLVVSLIPGTWDDELRKAAIILVNELIGILQRIEGEEEAVKAAKNAILAKTASKLIALQDGNELPENRYDCFQAIAYSADVKG